MTMIKPFPEFEKAISELPERQSWTLPILPDSRHLSEQVQIIETVERGEALLARLGRLSVGAVAIDTEFNFTSQPVDLGRGRTWLDPKTINPLLLSGAAWLPDTDRLVSFVFDLRRPALVPILADLLRLHTVFVAHFFNAEFKTLWRLGLEPVFTQMYDTWVAAKALTLGRGHQSVALLAEARASEDIQAEVDARCALVGHLSTGGSMRHLWRRAPLCGGKRNPATLFPPASSRCSIFSDAARICCGGRDSHSTPLSGTAA
jgi:hypothetical protein